MPNKKTDDIHVALFSDAASTGKSREAVYSLLSRTDGIDVDRVTSTTVRADGFFDQYDVFILPGGTASGEAKAIGAAAGKRIAKAVNDGKGLIAICAGGYYVAEGWNPDTAALDIINADNHDGKHWARGERFISVKTVGQPDAQSSRTMWYENGPIFVPADMAELTSYTTLVKFADDLHAKGAPAGQMIGRDAVIAAPYGDGRVVAFSPHPELSPEVHHWLINSIKWVAGRTGKNGRIDVETVLDGAPTK